MKHIDETTKKQKLRHAIHNIYHGLRTFGICTPENPMGNEVSERENEKRRASFKKRLKDGHYVYCPIRGKYGNEERSYFICNITLPALKKLNEEYEQESFIYSFVGDDGRLVHQYWERKGDGPYEMKVEKDRVVNQSDADDFFSKIGGYKFQIPFFEEVLEEAGRELKAAYGNYDEERLEESLDESRSGMSAWCNRGMLLVEGKKRSGGKKSVLARYFGIENGFGGGNPVLTEKINVSALYKRHGKSGFAILSANRTDKTDEENEQRTKNLISDLSRSGYRYLPVYGGYHGTDGVDDSYEPSFMVFPYDREGHEEEFDGLEDFALDMCGKYNQDSVFILRPGCVPHYYDENGKVKDKRASLELKMNDPSQMFFTSFKSKQDVEKEIDAKLMKGYKKFRADHPGVSFDEYKKEHIGDVKSVGRRFTADIEFDESAESGLIDEVLFEETMAEILVNPPYATLNELRMRQSRGEILLGKKGSPNQVY